MFVNDTLDATLALKNALRNTGIYKVIIEFNRGINNIYLDPEIFFPN